MLFTVHTSLFSFSLHHLLCVNIEQTQGICTIRTIRQQTIPECLCWTFVFPFFSFSLAILIISPKKERINKKYQNRSLGYLLSLHSQSPSILLHLSSWALQFSSGIKYMMIMPNIKCQPYNTIYYIALNEHTLYIRQNIKLKIEYGDSTLSQTLRMHTTHSISSYWQKKMLIKFAGMRMDVDCSISLCNYSDKLSLMIERIPEWKQTESNWSKFI